MQTVLSVQPPTHHSLPCHLLHVLMHTQHTTHVVPFIKCTNTHTPTLHSPPHAHTHPHLHSALRLNSSLNSWSFNPFLTFTSGPRSREGLGYKTARQASCHVGSADRESSSKHNSPSKPSLSKISHLQSTHSRNPTRVPHVPHPTPDPRGPHSPGGRG